jgi:hypothetical protein
MKKFNKVFANKFVSLFFLFYKTFLQTYAKQEFFFYGVLLAMERFFVYGENFF